LKKTYSILIIDDHPLIIKSYREAINRVEKLVNNIEFKIEEAKDCETVLEKLKLVSLNNYFDLVFLDIQLPASFDNKISSGEDLGLLIKKKIPKTKFLVITSLTDNMRLNNIAKTINPEGFLIKSDIDFIDIVKAVESILFYNGTFYSMTTLNLLRNHISNPFVLDNIDVQLLYELSNGASIKELIDLIPLSRAGIEKRKKILKSHFKIKNNSDRDLVLSARQKGFI
jgi:DNA-binding NarL/FixJ family response regulator